MKNERFQTIPNVIKINPYSARQELSCSTRNTSSFFQPLRHQWWLRRPWVAVLHAAALSSDLTLFQPPATPRLRHHFSPFYLSRPPSPPASLLTISTHKSLRKFATEIIFVRMSKCIIALYPLSNPAALAWGTTLEGRT